MKKAFTLLEILIVVVIIGLLLMGLQNLLKFEKKNLLWAKTCANMVYGDVRNFAQSAFTAKAVWANKITPEAYYIEVLPSDQRVRLSYGWTSTGIVQNYQLSESGTLRTSYKCNWSWYRVLLSGSDLTMNITKSLQQKWDTAGFRINQGATQLFTWNTELRFCNSDGNNCAIVSRFSYDARSAQIQHNICLNEGKGAQTCTKWSGQ